MSERQVLVLLSAMVSLAHHIVKVNFISWQVLGSTYTSVCSVSTEKNSRCCSSERYFEFHSRQECDICVCDSDITQQKKSLLDPAKSLPGLSAGRSGNLFPAVGAGFLWSTCGNKFPLEQVCQCWCSWRQKARQQAEGLGAEPECPLT